MILNFSTFLESGIKAYSKANTAETLGDRSKYVGSSDIGQCPRKCYLGKTQPAEHTLEQELVFLRGHIAEGFVRAALEGNNTPFQEQVEVEGLGFIKTHIDFLMHGRDGVDRIIECKSTSSIPDQPYSSWIYQVQLQMGLLRDSGGLIDRAIIAVFNVNTGEHTSFDIAYSEELYKMAIAKAQNLWNSMLNSTEPEGEVGNLCSFCPYKGSCKALNKGADMLPLDLEQDALELFKAQATAKEAGKKEAALKAKLIDFMSATGTKKVQVEDKTISYSEMKGRVSVNAKALQETYPDIYEEVKSEGKPYGMLKIS